VAHLEAAKDRIRKQGKMEYLEITVQTGDKVATVNACCVCV